jgi:UDP-glucuronate decarboxylase
VDDLIEGFVRIARLSKLDGPMNLGNPAEFTVAELAMLVNRLTGSKSPIEKRPLPADDPKQRKPNIEKAQKLIHFEPQVTLEHGIQRTIADFRERLAPNGGKARKDA